MIDYSQLYYHKDIMVQKDSIRPYPMQCDVQINDFSHRPDCKVGHFGYNFYFRTNAGKNYKKYSSEKRLEMEVEKLMKKNGFTVLRWLVKR